MADNAKPKATVRHVDGVARIDIDGDLTPEAREVVEDTVLNNVLRPAQRGALLVAVLRIRPQAKRVSAIERHRTAARVRHLDPIHVQILAVHVNAHLSYVGHNQILQLHVSRRRDYHARHARVVDAEVLKRHPLQTPWCGEKWCDSQV